MAKGDVWCQSSKTCVPVWKAAVVCTGMNEEQAEAELAKWTPPQVQVEQLPSAMKQATKAEIAVAEAVRKVWMTVYAPKSAHTQSPQNDDIVRQRREAEQRTKVIEAEKGIELAAQVSLIS